jgi:protease I
MRHDLQAGQRQSEEFLAEEPATLTGGPVARWGRDALAGLTVAVLVADGFEQAELDGPVEALKRYGARVEVLAPDRRHLGHVAGVHRVEPSRGTRCDRLLIEALPADYDALLVPGGLESPDAMRQSQPHLDFVRAILDAEKPVAMIGHALWLLADADGARDRTLTSWPAVRRDLERAGAHWQDQPVVIDGALITSRMPADVPAFSEALVRALVRVR